MDPAANQQLRPKHLQMAYFETPMKLKMEEKGLLAGNVQEAMCLFRGTQDQKLEEGRSDSITIAKTEHEIRE